MARSRTKSKLLFNARNVVGEEKPLRTNHQMARKLPAVAIISAGEDAWSDQRLTK